MAAVATEVETRQDADWNSYQTFLSVRSDGDLIHRVEEQLEAWLRNRPKTKHWDPPTEETGFSRGSNGEDLLILRPEPRSPREGRDFRARLIEPSADGQWRTNLTLHAETENEGWIALGVANEHGRFANVPVLATYLLDALDAYDGGTLLSAEPRVMRGGDVDGVMEELCHVDRQDLFFIAGTDERQGFDTFVKRVRRWTREVRGLAQVVVLDPAATREFNGAMGRSHEAPVWTVRTFLPDVDPAVSADGRRHRYLSRERLASLDDKAIALLIGRIARKYSAERTPPAKFNTVNRRLARVEQDLLLSPLTQQASEEEATAAQEIATADSELAPQEKAPPPPSESRAGDSVAEGANTYLAQIELVKAVLGIPEVSEQTLRDFAHYVERGQASADQIDRISTELATRQGRIEHLEDEVAYYKELYEETELETALEAERADKREDEARWLRQCLAEHEDYDAAYGVVPDEFVSHVPLNFAELLERLGGLAAGGVVFTGDREKTLALDEHDTCGRAAGEAWKVLLALTDYLRSCREDLCDKGVADYLEHTPPGFHSVPPGKFAENESSETMHKYGSERMFPVPATIDPSGKALMAAHFRLARIGRISPRLHYLDCNRVDGNIYVGYIGRHLRNMLT